MEARSFFENSPMAEITVTATKEEWYAILHDMHEPGDRWPPEAIDLINQLKKVGVEY